MPRKHILSSDGFFGEISSVKRHSHEISTRFSCHQELSKPALNCSQHWQQLPLSSGRSRICQWLTKTKRLKYTGCKKDVPMNRRLLKSLLHTYTGRSLRSWYPNRKDRTCSTSSLQLLSVICCYQHVSELSSFMVNKLIQNHISPTRNNLKCHIILDVTT